MEERNWCIPFSRVGSLEMQQWTCSFQKFWSLHLHSWPLHHRRYEENWRETSSNIHQQGLCDSQCLENKTWKVSAKQRQSFKYLLIGKWEVSWFEIYSTSTYVIFPFMLLYWSQNFKVSHWVLISYSSITFIQTMAWLLYISDN